MNNLHRPDGTLLPGVFAFRTLDDTRAMIASAAREDSTRAIVIGGGLLGLEAARGLQRFGLEVGVVHAASHLMSAQVGHEAGQIIQRKVESLGITVHTSARTTGLLGTDQSRAGALDGTELACDLVIVAAGIRPNVDVAETSGFTVERAIVVEDDLRTVDDPHVWAVGECVQHRGRGVRPGRAAVGAGGGAGRPDHRPRPSARYHGSRPVDQAQGRRRRCGRDGSAGPRA